MDVIGRSANLISSLDPSRTIDGIDQMVSIKSALLSILFGFLVNSNAYTANPLNCFIPQHYANQWEKFIETECYIYKLSSGSLVDTRERYEFRYYPWVGYFFVGQGLLMVIPYCIWLVVSKNNGFNTDQIIENAKTTTKKNHIVEFVTDNTDGLATNFLIKMKEGSKLKKLMLLNNFKSKIMKDIFNSQLTICYLAYKFANLSTLFLQMYLMCKFFKLPKFYRAGYDLLVLITGEVNWGQTKYFPTDVVCNVGIHEEGLNRNKTSLQCIARLNVFIQLFVLFMWFAYAILLVLCLGNLMIWLALTYHPETKNKIVEKALHDIKRDLQVYEVNEFVNKELSRDGITVIRMVNEHYGEKIAEEIIIQAYKQHEEKKMIGEISLRNAHNGQITYKESSDTIDIPDNFKNEPDLINFTLPREQRHAA
uniref:Innexin n=1 Tax=Rhabditophanes sp. KR3021 TaxID=114890 RepID=A0AC35THF0_9BILA